MCILCIRRVLHRSRLVLWSGTYIAKLWLKIHFVQCVYLIVIFVEIYTTLVWISFLRNNERPMGHDELFIYLRAENEQCHRCKVLNENFVSHQIQPLCAFLQKKAENRKPEGAICRQTFKSYWIVVGHQDQIQATRYIMFLCFSFLTHKV